MNAHYFPFKTLKGKQQQPLVCCASLFICPLYASFHILVFSMQSRSLFSSAQPVPIRPRKRSASNGRNGAAKTGTKQKPTRMTTSTNTHIIFTLPPLFFPPAGYVYIFSAHACTVGAYGEGSFSGRARCVRGRENWVQARNTFFLQAGMAQAFFF